MAAAPTFPLMATETPPGSALDTSTPGGVPHETGQIADNERLSGFHAAFEMVTRDHVQPELSCGLLQ
jgi:hypothetical protein